VAVLLVNMADASSGLALLSDWRVNLTVLGVLGSAAAIAGWFVLRGRPTRSFAVLPIAVLAAFGGLAPSPQFAWAVCVIVPVTIAWAGWLISRIQPAAGGEVRADRTESDADPSAMTSLSHSAGTHIYRSVSGDQKTNTLALLSLIFGLLGFGLVPIVLGHIARSQIRRTGEGGGGMALAGLILGYVIVGLGIAYVIVWVVLLWTIRSATLGP
jgi:hypothetical protein